MVGGNDRPPRLQRSRDSGQGQHQSSLQQNPSPSRKSSPTRISGNSGILFAIGFVLDASSFVIVMSGLVLLICNGVVIGRSKNANLSFRPKYLPFFCGTLVRIITRSLN